MEPVDLEELGRSTFPHETCGPAGGSSAAGHLSHPFPKLISDGAMDLGDRMTTSKMTKSASTDTELTLSGLRGTLQQAPASARAVAALTQNPGCTRRRVIDASGIPAHTLAERVGFPATRGQSPFAITSGNAFEDQLKRRSNYEGLVSALRPFVDLPTDGLIVSDLNNVGHYEDKRAWKDARVAKTDKVLSQLARGDADAPHIVDHPMLIMDLSGTSLYLEPDALAFRVGSDLELVEIKSFPIIDGQADPSKVSATAGQSAVYVLALRATLERLGFDPEILRWSVILVAPRNFGRQPTAHRVPLRKKAMSISRVLDGAASLSDVLSSLPPALTLDVGVGSEADPVETARRLEMIPCLFVPECLSSCDLASFCREQAIRDDSPSRLGRQVRDMLGGVERLGDALILAEADPASVDEEYRDVAESLHFAMGALKRARGSLPSKLIRSSRWR